MKHMPHRQLLLAILLAFALLIVPLPAAAHCDTLDGPVVAAARLALKTGDVTPALKWVKPDAEAEIRAAFAQTARVRELGADARELAERFFFETLVRVHREGEGAPFSGLKSAGSEIEPGILLADKAVESGSADELIRTVTGDVANGLHHRFDELRQAAAHSDDSMEAGRRHVAAYVEFIHYVEHLQELATARTPAHSAASPERHAQR